MAAGKGAGAGGRFVKGNIFGQGALGMAVGDPAYLNSQESRVARYWRTIEYGTEGFVGKIIGGLWTSSFASQSERGDLIGGSTLSTFGGADQKFVPFFGGMQTQQQAVESALRALGFLRAHGDLPFQLYRMYRKRLLADDLNVPTIGRIHHEIPAMEAYRKGFEAFDPVQRERDAIAQVFGSMSFFTAKGAKRTVLSQRTRQRQTTTSAQLRSRTGFIKAHALSGFNASLAKVDATFRSELTQVNRLLSQGLAAEVAQVITDEHLRPGVATKTLAEATLDQRNRFPT